MAVGKASPKHAAGKSRVMSKARWDKLSNNEKYDMYAGQRPGAKKKTKKTASKLGRHGGGKEAPKRRSYFEKARSPSSRRTGSTPRGTR